MTSFKLITSSVIFLFYCSLVFSQAEVASDDDSSKVTDETTVPIVHYSTPQLNAESEKHHFYESFDDEIIFNNRWIRSKTTKAESQDLKYDGEWDLVDSHSSIVGK